MGIQDEVGISCRITEPEPESLEEREFVLAPPGKDRFRSKKTKGQRNNNKRARRSRKSSNFKSSNNGSRHRNGNRKGKGKHRSRGRSNRGKPRS